MSIDAAFLDARFARANNTTYACESARVHARSISMRDSSIARTQVGLNEVGVRAIDNSGNEMMRTVVVLIDASPPTLSEVRVGTDPLRGHGYWALRSVDIV